MRRARSVGLALVLAVLLPIYPYRTEVRSFFAGGGGDRVDVRWSLRWLWAIREALAYEREVAAMLIADVAVLLVVVALLTWGIRALERWLAARRGPRA